MNFRRHKIDPEARAREALSLVVTLLADRIDEGAAQTAAMRAELADLRAQVAALPDRVAWAQRYLTDAEHTPELLTQIAVEVAAFKAERPDEYTNILHSITVRAANARRRS